jgi:hypothetical protein
MKIAAVIIAVAVAGVAALVAAIAWGAYREINANPEAPWQ